MLRSKPIAVAFAIVAALALSVRAEAAAPTKLSRQQVLDINRIVDFGDMRPWGFRARSGKLYFLLSSPSGLHKVLIAKPDGSLIRTVDISPTQLIGDWIDVDSSENLIVRRIQKGQNGYFEKVFRLAPDGRELHSFDAHPGFFAAAVAGDAFIGVSRTELAVFDQDGHLHKAIPWKDTARVSELTPEERNRQFSVVMAAPNRDRVAVFQRLELQADLFDLRTGERSTVQVSSPTLKAFRDKLHPLQNRTTLIGATAGAEDGSLFPSVGKWDPAIGVPVLRLSTSVSELDSYLCGPLPTFERFRNSANPEGFMHPTTIQVDGQSLFVYDQRGALVRCQLPPR